MGISGVPLEKCKIIQAIHKKRGIITHTAELLGCDPTCIYHWMKKDTDVATAIKEAREQGRLEKLDENEQLLDKAYKSASLNLQEFDVTMTIFILKTLGGLKEQDQKHSVNINLVDKPYVESTDIPTFNDIDEYSNPV